VRGSRYLLYDILIEIKDFLAESIQTIQVILMYIVSLSTFLVITISVFYTTYYLFFEFAPIKVLTALALSVVFIHINKSFQGV
jgi:hypothetical protein